ncbi:MAG: heparan-alpha-glucosaminide N-acetyltransferase [Desulfotomaculaceae bacterium]|nr:heparan-alpha-glucosaminide N-acetyltransferase [Desulfotomaculaceae bacterium]
MVDKRIWEIDLLRTMAIIFMVAFHIVVDLNRFVGIDIDYLSGFWYWEGKASALTFIFLAGISSGFSKNNFIRGIKVLAYGMTITLVTYIFFREQYIRFGILHLLGTSMILFPLFKRINNLLLLISAVVIALTAIPLNNVFAHTSLLLPLGVMYKGFATLDYYPLSPYFAMFILGILAHKLYYYKRQSLYPFSYENKYISTISKHSLAIYLVHQPVIIGVISLLKFLHK